MTPHKTSSIPGLSLRGTSGPWSTSDVISGKVLSVVDYLAGLHATCFVHLILRSTVRCEVVRIAHRSCLISYLVTLLVLTTSTYDNRNHQYVYEGLPKHTTSVTISTLQQRRHPFMYMSMCIAPQRPPSSRDAPSHTLTPRTPSNKHRNQSPPNAAPKTTTPSCPPTS